MIPVGTPVTVDASQDNYLKGYGMSREDLVVLAHSGNHYGLGPAKNNPAKAHSEDGWIFFSASEVTPKEESKTVTQFNKGDKVEILDDYMSAKKGDTLTVTESGSWHTYATHDATGVLMGGYNSRFKIVEEPKPFTFKDIQKGDTIRRTQKFKGGATEVREGIVSKLASWYVGIDGNYILAYDTDDKTEDVTLELLNRPEPEPEPTLLENTKIGDTLVIRYKSGSTKVYTKARHDGECWDTLVIHANGKVGKGARWSNTELEEAAASHSAESTDLITK